jgi:hypothetical protein
MHDTDRRRFLKTLGALGAGGLAGCASDDSSTGTAPPSGQGTTTTGRTTRSTRTETATPEPEEHIDVRRWASPAAFDTGEFRGARVTEDGSLAVADPAGEREYTDPHGNGTAGWEYGRWTSPTYRLDYGAKELVASWTADAPEGTWVEVEMRGDTTDGDRTGWYVMGRWAETTTDVHRTTVPDQADRYGRVAIDVFEAANDVALGAYQLRMTLHRLPGTDRSPAVRSVSGMTSRLPDQRRVDTSPPGSAGGITLDVPQHSQNLHRGEYEQWGGGGAAWCSPTATYMVMSYWGREPTDEQMSWVPSDYEDPEVAFAARGTYDYNYGGTGNWPFNVAFAGRFGLEGFVTRLHSLTELEQFIEAGIPVITSQAFEEYELPSAGYGSNGHLMVVVGFTEDGDVVGNDPFQANNEAVRTVFSRGAFENVWQRTTETGGIAYVIHPPGHELPDVASLR